MEEDESFMKKISLMRFEREWYVKESLEKIVSQEINRIEKIYR